MEQRSIQSGTDHFVSLLIIFTPPRPVWSTAMVGGYFSYFFIYFFIIYSLFSLITASIGAPSAPAADL